MHLVGFIIRINWRSFMKFDKLCAIVDSGVLQNDLNAGG